MKVGLHWSATRHKTTFPIYCKHRRHWIASWHGDYPLGRLESLGIIDKKNLRVFFACKIAARSVEDAALILTRSDDPSHYYFYLLG